MKQDYCCEITLKNATFMTDPAEKLRAELERLEQKKKKVQENLLKAKAKLKERERKNRTRRLIELGGLVEIAGLSDVNRGALLGAMLEISPILGDQTTYQNLKHRGEEILHERSRRKYTLRPPAQDG